MEFTEGGTSYRINAVPRSMWSTLREQGVQFYDYTKLTAANTCPTWGVLRYGLHRTEIPLSTGGRNLAVECGSACHDFFAAIRWWALRERDIGAYTWLNAHFGTERSVSMLEVPQDSDRVNNAQLFALEALHSSGYYDDPNDKRRTMANMEAACLVYADRYFQSDLPVYFDPHDMFVGIEVPFVLEVERMCAPWTKVDTHYYCGRIDGLHTMGKDGELVVGENKTASRISDVWRMSFAISHQVTGYVIAAETILNAPVNNAIVMGVQIPLPRDIFDGVSFELVTRTESDKVRWCEWLFHSIETYERWIDRPHDAPRYSHSCNRFFSACEMIPYCALERREQVQALVDMRVNEWSPLDHIEEKSVEGDTT
jgi:hypothetical protein